jgi:hypothetical protein
MKKQSLFSTASVMTSLKALAVNIVASLILLIPLAIGIWLRQTNVVISWIMYLVVIVGELFVWGWLANKFWHWK